MNATRKRRLVPSLIAEPSHIKINIKLANHFFAHVRPLVQAGSGPPCMDSYLFALPPEDEEENVSSDEKGENT